MKRICLSIVIAGLLCVSLCAEDAKDEKKVAAPKIISATEAKDHVDESVIVTGKVAQVSIREKMVYLDIDKPYPGSPLSAVIFAAKTNQFGDLEKLKDKNVELSGKVAQFRERVEIVLLSTNQLKVVEKNAVKETPAEPVIK